MKGFIKIVAPRGSNRKERVLIAVDNIASVKAYESSATELFLKSPSGDYYIVEHDFDTVVKKIEEAMEDK